MHLTTPWKGASSHRQLRRQGGGSGEGRGTGEGKERNQGGNDGGRSQGKEQPDRDPERSQDHLRSRWREEPWLEAWLLTPGGWLMVMRWSGALGADGTGRHWWSWRQRRSRSDKCPRWCQRTEVEPEGSQSQTELKGLRDGAQRTARKSVAQAELNLFKLKI